MHAESIIFSQEALELLEIPYGGRMHITCDMEDKTAFAVVPNLRGHKLNKARTISVKGAHEYLVRGEYGTTNGIDYKLIDPDRTLTNMMITDEQPETYHYRLSPLACKVRSQISPLDQEAYEDEMMHELTAIVLSGSPASSSRGFLDAMQTAPVSTDTFFHWEEDQQSVPPKPSCSSLAAAIRILRGEQDDSTRYYHGSFMPL